MLQESRAELAPPRLRLLRLELTLVMDDPVELPAFRGNLWRGVLGPALKLIDDGMLPDISTGVIERGTLYRTFFESPPPPDAAKMRRYNAAPHPYVVDAPGTATSVHLPAGARERIGLTLVGRAATALEAVLAAFDFAARAGIGRSAGGARARGRARLVGARAVWRGDDPDAVVLGEETGYCQVTAAVPPVPPCPSRLRVLLATPLRLTQDGRPVGPREFTPGLLLSSLVRRVSMLSEFFGEASLETDFRALKAMWTSLVAREPRLAFTDQARWSGHQQKELDMGGLVGSFTLDMRGAEALFPYLWLGQWIHAGKGAALGMGAIRIRTD